MLTLKQLINRYISTLALILIIFSLMFASCIQIKLTRDRTYEDALLTLSQVEQIMHENQQELDLVQKEYHKTCLLNAKVVSYFIDAKPEILYNLEELRDLATHLEVDEIHIFDETGRIFTGTHPEYYNYTFDSGEQIAFFKPLLTDKSLELVQSIVPNTAEEKLMQYSALWSKSGEYIVQIGMNPVNVEKSTAKNELSYIFSLFRVNPNIFYYAIDGNTGKIIGSSQSEFMDLDCTELGFSFQDIEYADQGIIVEVDGHDCFCVFHKVDSTYIGYVVRLQYLYREVPGTIFALLFCMVIISCALVFSFNEYMKTHIVNKISKINNQLSSITRGNSNQIVDVRNVFELSELSSHINNLVQNFISSNTKLSYVFSKINFYVGTYEYGNQMETVHFSEHIPELLSLDTETLDRLSTNPDDFKKYIADIRKHTVSDEPNIYAISDKYIKIDEVIENGFILGVVMDVTNDVKKRQKLEFAIHLDPLTGLYNFKGFEITLSELFSKPETLGYYAFISIMAEGLTNINTTYGYDKGDLYLQKIAAQITDFGIKNSLATRQGGGEFVLFLYGYDSKNELEKAINLLTYIQNHTLIHINDTTDIPLKFTFGYCLSNSSEATDYHQLLKAANDRKYNNHG